MEQAGHRTIALLRRVLRDEQGLSAIEYGILASLIALAAMQALGGLGFETAQNYNTTGDKLAEQRARQTADEPAATGNQTPDEPAPLVADPGPGSNGNADEPATAAGIAPPGI